MFGTGNSFPHIVFPHCFPYHKIERIEPSLCCHEPNFLSSSKGMETYNEKSLNKAKKHATTVPLLSNTSKLNEGKTQLKVGGKRIEIGKDNIKR